MTDLTALTQLKLVPARTVQVGSQVLCAIPESDDPESSLVSDFNHHLEGDMVIVDPNVIANPGRCGYTRAEVAVQLFAPVSHVETKDGWIYLVLAGGKDLNFSVKVSPHSRVRAMDPAPA